MTKKGANTPTLPPAYSPYAPAPNLKGGKTLPRIHRRRCTRCGGYIEYDARYFWQAQALCTKCAREDLERRFVYYPELVRVMLRRRGYRFQKEHAPKAQAQSGFRVKKHAKPKTVKVNNGRR